MSDRLTGAILFRGFRITEGTDFEDIVMQYEPELSDEYRGVSPRKLIPGTKVSTHLRTSDNNIKHTEHDLPIC